MQAIILNCFGRGGSSLLWNLIGSSPSVCMTKSEWHEAFYKTANVYPKALKQFIKQTSLKVPQSPLLVNMARRRAEADISTNSHNFQPEARKIVLKLMDYHLAWTDVLDSAFAETHHVILIRHPYAQCESFLRSGMSIQQAAKYYRNIARRMRAIGEEKNGIVVSFEDLAARPEDTLLELYERLSLSFPITDTYFVKRKSFGSSRKSNDLAIGDILPIASHNLSNFIDPSVNDRSVARLSASQKETIWKYTNTVARYFGYCERYLE